MQHVKETQLSLSKAFLSFSFAISFALYFSQYLTFVSLWDIVALGFGGVVALWSYAIIALHGSRALYYRLFVFPKLKEMIDMSLKPDELLVMVMMYKIPLNIFHQVIVALISEVRAFGVKATIYLGLSDKENLYESEVNLVKQVLRDIPGSNEVNIVVQPQLGLGKRNAMEHGDEVLQEALKKHSHPERVIACSMDGDTQLTPGIFAKCAPYVLTEKLKPVGGFTTDNRAVTKGESSIYTVFSNLRLLLRTTILSSIVTVLTGRFQLMRGDVLAGMDLGKIVGNDWVEYYTPYQKLQNLLHKYLKFIPKATPQYIKLVTGDDKSTVTALRKRNWELMYIPNAYVYCHETEPKYGFDPNESISENRMRKFLNFIHHGIYRILVRLAKNMLIGADRELNAPVKQVGLIRYLTYFDQSYGYWRPLWTLSYVFGLTCAFGMQILSAYVMYVMMTRSFVIVVKEKVIRYPYKRSLEDEISWWLQLPMQSLLLWCMQMSAPFIKKIAKWNLDIQEFNRTGNARKKRISSAEAWLRAFGVTTELGVIVLLGFIPGYYFLHILG
jgi:glycosyltransferase Alg8